MDSKTNRNHCFDFIKGVACICVVFMHCEFPGKLGVIVQCVSRFCVPFFFMISGYYAYNADGEGKAIKKKTRHILTITFWAYLFYFLFYSIKCLGGKGPNFSFGFKEVIAFLLFNAPLFSTSQLWFLFALLYVYIIYHVLEKYVNFVWVYSLIPILLLCYIALAQGMHLSGYHMPNYVYRNFLFEGLPLFLLGRFLHEKETRTLALDSRHLIGVLVFSTLACIPERMLLGRDFGMNICTIPQVSSCFILGMKHHVFGHDSFLEYFGRNYSMLVYIFHPFVIQILTCLLGLIGILHHEAVLYALPILTLIFTVIMSWMFKILIDFIPRKKAI